jgi:predicted MFS family arabinose efflux permease
MRYRSSDSGLGLVIALILNVIGTSTFNILPLLGQGVSQTLGFSDRQVGVMSLAISVGSGASAVFAGFWVRSVPWPRSAAVMLAGMVVANSLAALVHDYWPFVVLQGAAGFFGGSLLCLAMTILSDQRDSARSFGAAQAVQVAYQVAGMLIGPTLLRLSGVSGLLVALAVLSGATLLLAPLLPACGRPVSSGGMSSVLLKPATVMGLIGMGAYFVNFGAYWTYIELLGQSRGMTSQLASNCIAVGISAGILGGTLASIVGDRFGRLLPLGVATIVTVGASLLLGGSSGVAAFVISVVLYFFACTYSLAYQTAIINLVDVTGRAVALTGGFAALGAAGGAALGAVFVTPGDYSAVVWLAVIAVCVSTALFMLSSAIHRHETGSLRACSNIVDSTDLH